MGRTHPKNSGKAPSFQFYWKDWKSETKLDLIDDASRGIWIDLMAASCDMPTPGVFWADGKALSVQALTRFIHGTDETHGWRARRIDKLVTQHILKRFPADHPDYPDAYYVKRIYRDMQIRRERRVAGGKGGKAPRKPVDRQTDWPVRVRRHYPDAPDDLPFNERAYLILTSTKTVRARPQCVRCHRDGTPAIVSADDDEMLYYICGGCHAESTAK